MRLSQAEMHQRYKVNALHLKDTMRLRLVALGMTTASEIMVIQKKKNGAMIINLRGTRFAIGRPVSEGIEVEPCPVN